MDLGGHVTQHVLEHSASHSAVGRSDGSWSSLVI
jgi:hypothetical protein